MDSIQAAKIFSVPTAFIMAGYFTSASHSTIPIIVGQPASISTPTFAKVYHTGAGIMVPLTIIATSAYGYLAYSTKDPRERRLYTAGAVLTLGVLPWTVGVMFKGIQRLIYLSENSAPQIKAEATGEIKQLLNAWKNQNWVRAGLAISAGLAGLSALTS